MNQRQRAFCEAYLLSGNATEAAIKAGYSPKSARSIGQRLLTYVDIREYLAQRNAQIITENTATLEEIYSFWTVTMRDQASKPADRLKASELLSKALIVERTRKENSDQSGAGHEFDGWSDEELRGRIGVVPQKAVLFKGTIRSNLQWGKPDATEEEMWKALELAQASEVVDGKPGKLDATVAQNGKNFSGGQRQRLTIARALVREPEILILDDSASALDYATDAKLRAALRTLEDKTTTFIVSQRASTIRHADKIIVLDDGEIAGVGTHDELLKDCTVYQEIYYSQYPEQRGGVR